MRQRYSICIFCILIVVCIVVIVAAAGNTGREETPEQMPQAGVKPATEEDEPETVLSSKTEEPYRYVIYNVDGHLLVYYADHTTVFFDSGILEENLTRELCEALTMGIRFQTEEELYEFLENYSS